MAVRNKRRCRNCPQKEAAKAASAQSPPAPPRVLSISTESEGNRLWKHVLFGTGTCVGMCEGYANLNMPGNPLPELTALRDRLNKLISKYEGKRNVSDLAAE